MLYLILVWLALLAVCSIVGNGTLALIRDRDFDDIGDRFIASTWLGLVILCVALLAVSFVVPLSLSVGLLGFAVLTTSALTLRRVRVAMAIACCSLTLGSISLSALLTISIAALMSQQIWWFDTGLYHLGSIQWLSEFGAVPGVALINPKFSFASSWFAFAAPLTPEFLGDRIGAVSNGYIYFLDTLQVAIALSKIVSGRAKVSDGFLFVFFAIVISIYLASSPASPILISFSADVAVTSLVGITAWAILVTSAEPKPLTNPLQQSDPLDRKTASILDSRLVPLILAVGAVTIKLTALPLLPIA
ncbi:hypothetical protein IQ235_11730, partial [Oscillatoriales cyanobacterium LEGE 11467]